MYTPHVVLLFDDVHVVCLIIISPSGITDVIGCR